MTFLRSLLLLWIIQQVFTIHQSYITLPFLRLQNNTHSVHNFMVEINQYPYQIDLNLEGNNDYFISLNNSANSKLPNPGPDYRKHPDTVYGVLDFIGNQKADMRRTIFQQTKSNLYYSIRDLLPQQTWIDLRHMQQIDSKISNLTEGTVNLASAKHSPFLLSLKKNNPYIREQIISFKLSSNNKNGQLYFGTFPKHELLQLSDYSQVKLYNDHQKAWKINIEAIKLKRNLGQGQISTGSYIFSLSIRFSVSVSLKTLRLPKQAGMALQTMLNGCTMKQISTQKLFTCRASTLDLYKSFSIEFLVTKAKTPLQIRLSDLVREIADDQVIFNIAQGTDDNYHISSTILREYLIGIDYGKGMLSYGRKRGDQWFSRYLFAKLFLAVNIIIFIFSLLILTVANKLKQSSQPQPSVQSTTSKQKKRAYSASKASGYQMAEMQEKSPQQLQD